MSPDDVSPLLLCLDLEFGSEQLIDYAARHARRCALPLRVLHASRAALDEKKHQQLQARIHELIDHPLEGLRLQAIDIETGEAEDIIVEVARRHDADLILLGRRHRTTADRIYVGSTTSAVISLATKPVLVVPVGTIGRGRQ